MSACCQLAELGLEWHSNPSAANWHEDKKNKFLQFKELCDQEDLWLQI
jgi:hypothetical protein